MAAKSFLFIQEPLWLANRQGFRHKFTGNVQSWIYESGSITQRLRSLYGSDVAVRVLFQKWCIPYLSERKSLGLSGHQFNLCREVLIHANGIPLVLARTIIPTQTIKVAPRKLSRLGTRPLGEVIFSYPELERLSLDVSLIKPSEWTQSAHDTANINRPVTGRRTLYAIANHQLLVSEFFLPELFRQG